MTQVTANEPCAKSMSASCAANASHSVCIQGLMAFTVSCKWWLHDGLQEIKDVVTGGRYTLLKYSLTNIKS